MSDIPSGALDAGPTRAVSLLSRVILPRPGEPLDVRKLYIEESTTNARRAHAPTRTTLEIGTESEVSFATYFNAFPASYWRRWSILESVVLRVELVGSARVDVYRSKATGARITVGGSAVSSGDSGTPAVAEFEIGIDPFEDGGWIWFDITTNSPVDRAQRRLVCTTGRPRQGQRRGGHPDVQPPGGLRQRPGRAHVGSVGGRGDHRGHRHRPGHQQGQGPSRVRRCRSGSRHSPVRARPAEPRRIRRLQPGDVRGAEEHRLRTDSVHGRRHPHRAGLDPAGAGVESLREVADAHRRPDAESARAVASSRHGRDGRPRELHVDRRGQHRVRPQLRQVPAQRRRGAAQQAAAPAHRRRLQRLVDVHDPAVGGRGTRSAVAAVHQVGRRRIRPAGGGARLSDRDAARCCDLAHGVERQGRRHRLAGLLPPAQPLGRRGHALGRQHPWADREPSQGDIETPSLP